MNCTGSFSCGDATDTMLVNSAISIGTREQVCGRSSIPSSLGMMLIVDTAELSVTVLECLSFVGDERLGKRKNNLNNPHAHLEVNFHLHL